MKKVGIITLTGNENFGNRLQCYALQKYCNNNFNMKFTSLNNYPYLNNRHLLVLRVINHNIKKQKFKYEKEDIEKAKRFKEFNQNITCYNRVINAYSNLNKFDFLIVGSDQIWNPKCGGLKDVDTLRYVKNNKKISYAASIGVSDLEEKYRKIIKKRIGKFKKISVREDRGKEIIKEETNRKDIEVLIDPTLLLTRTEWKKVSKEPEQYRGEKYILSYFLGEIPKKRKSEIQRIADEKNYKIINILDKKDKYYISGPSEFLWLEEHAELICTDSFHSAVFALIFDKPFIVFEREKNGKNTMGNRIDTLLSKLKIENRRFNGESITKENIEHNYNKSYEIIEKERKKSYTFLKDALYN